MRTGEEITDATVEAVQYLKPQIKVLRDNARDQLNIQSVRYDRHGEVKKNIESKVSNLVEFASKKYKISEDFIRKIGGF